MIYNEKGSNMISVVTVNYNDADNTIKYANNILTFKSVDQVIIVDNKSKDNSYIVSDKLNSPLRDRIK